MMKRKMDKVAEFVSVVAGLCVALLITALPVYVVAHFIVKFW